MYSSSAFPSAGTHGTDGLAGACASGFHAAERSMGAHPTASKATTARTWRDRIRGDGYLLRPSGASKWSRLVAGRQKAAGHIACGISKTPSTALSSSTMNTSSTSIRTARTSRRFAIAPPRASAGTLR